MEPIIRVKDIAWIRLQSPDLGKQEEFLTDFGLVRAERNASALYMRGCGTDHHIHITQKGAPGVCGIAFRVNSMGDLEHLGETADGASSIEELDEPGGGHRVRLRDPSGMPIEIVYGVALVSEIPVTPRVLNTATNKHAREGELLRVAQAPSRIKRIGHAVISTPQLEKSVQWAHRHLGIVRSDDVHAEDNQDQTIGSFNRIDGGEAYVDHHVVLYVPHTSPGLNHVAFEVQDFDDLAVGHEYMKKSHEQLHVWGIGRHTLGSQIFDYWKDPWGRLHEHWTDSDMLNDQHNFQRHPRSLGFKSQWGSPSPEEFRDSSSPITGLDGNR